VLYVGRFESVGITLFYRKFESQFFVGYPYGYILDLAMVPIAPRGPAETYGYWMQPSTYSRT
jgi:hypothetical protein